MGVWVVLAGVVLDATAATSPPNIACFAAKSAVATTNAPPPLTNTVLQYPASPLDWSNQAAA